MNTDLGFDVEEFADDSRWTAYVGTWIGERGSKGAAHPNAAEGAYAVLTAGHGAPAEPLWGAGLFTTDDVIRAAAINEVLKIIPFGRLLVVRCKGLSKMIDYARAAILRGGMKTDGKTPFDGLPYFQPLVQAEDAGRLLLSPIGPRQEDATFRRALARVEDLPRKTAIAYKVIHPHIEANTVIATGNDPDPFGLFKK